MFSIVKADFKNQYFIVQGWKLVWFCEVYTALQSQKTVSSHL